MHREFYSLLLGDCHEFNSKQLLTLGWFCCLVATTRASQGELHTSFVVPGTSLGTYSVGSSVLALPRQSNSSEKT